MLPLNYEIKFFYRLTYCFSENIYLHPNKINTLSGKCMKFVVKLITSL